MWESIKSFSTVSELTERCWAWIAHCIDHAVRLDEYVQKLAMHCAFSIAVFFSCVDITAVACSKALAKTARWILVQYLRIKFLSLRRDWKNSASSKRKGKKCSGFAIHDDEELTYRVDEEVNAKKRKCEDSDKFLSVFIMRFKTTESRKLFNIYRFTRTVRFMMMSTKLLLKNRYTV